MAFYGYHTSLGSSELHGLKVKTVCQNSADKATFRNAIDSLPLAVHKISMCGFIYLVAFPDSIINGDNMGPTWGRQDPGGPHVGPMNFAIWV